VAFGQKSSSSRNSYSTSCCTQCHFDIQPLLGVAARAVFSADFFASLMRAEEEPEKGCHQWRCPRARCISRLALRHGIGSISAPLPVALTPASSANAGDHLQPADLLGFECRIETTHKSISPKLGRSSRAAQLLKTCGHHTAYHEGFPVNARRAGRAGRPILK
jgi:hypothetical protein